MAGKLRTPRKRALEVNDSSNFGANPGYDSQAGMPKGTPNQGGVYTDNVPPPNPGPKPQQA